MTCRSASVSMTARYHKKKTTDVGQRFAGGHVHHTDVNKVVDPTAKVINAFKVDGDKTLTLDLP